MNAVSYASWIGITRAPCSRPLPLCPGEDLIQARMAAAAAADRIGRKVVLHRPHDIRCFNNIYTHTSVYIRIFIKVLLLDKAEHGHHKTPLAQVLWLPTLRICMYATYKIRFTTFIHPSCVCKWNNEDVRLCVNASDYSQLSYYFDISARLTRVN